MPTFHYTARSAKGKKIKGMIDATSPRHARQLLRDQSCFPLAVERVEDAARSSAGSMKRRSSPRVSVAATARIMRQIATLAVAGIPLDEALGTVVDQTTDRRTKFVIAGVRARVMEGYSLADSVAAFPRVFPAMYQRSIEAGERSGQLALALNELADYSERQLKITRKVQQALLYPALMFLVCVAVVFFMMTYVVPKIIAVFEQTHQALPMVTQVLLALSGFLQQYGGVVLLALVLLLVLLRSLLRIEAIGFVWDGLLMRLPMIGRAIETVNSARFLRTFGLLMAATVPVLDAMRIASGLITNRRMRQQVLASVDPVKEGGSIAKALRSTACFSPTVLQLIALGESSGQLEQLLQKAAQEQEEQLQNTLGFLLTLFEPLMILIMGGVVLFIVLAVMLPIFSLDNFNG